jgi:cytochrome P450
MSLYAPLTSGADTTRVMPASATARLDAARIAVASLREEQRRLQRIGFETPLARCHEQLRYWNFVQAVCSLAPEVRS